MEVVIFFIAHWYLSLFCQTFFHHRYSAHRMFTMSKGWEKFFYVCTYIFQGASFLSPRAYGILHRLHHAHADTENDPHSPKYDENIFKMMWKTKSIYNDILHDRADVDEKYKKNLPNWDFIEKLGDQWLSRLFWAFVYIGFHVYFIDMPEQWYLYLFLPFHFVMGPFHGAIINWYAHLFGYRNYEVSDTSKNMWPIEVIMLGEGLHNNHHARGNNPNFGYAKWYEFDLAYPFIWLFNKLSYH